MENSGYLLGAFAVIWSFIFAYILYLSNIQRRLRREIDSLKDALKDTVSQQ